MFGMGYTFLYNYLKIGLFQNNQDPSFPLSGMLILVQTKPISRKILENHSWEIYEVYSELMWCCDHKFHNFDLSKTADYYSSL